MQFASLQVYLALDAAAERDVSKMAGALARLRAAAAAAADSGFAQGQLVNEMYRRTAELKVRCFLLPSWFLLRASARPRPWWWARRETLLEHKAGRQGQQRPVCTPPWRRSRHARADWY